jgi:hypothetical protein
MVVCPLLPWTTSSATTVDSCHIHSSSPLSTSDQVQGYSKSNVETDGVALELETDAATPELETDAADLKLKTDAAGLKLETDTISLKLETDASTLELETDVVALDLEKETDVSLEISKLGRYPAD